MKLTVHKTIALAALLSVSAGTYAYSNFGRHIVHETNTDVSNNSHQVGAGIPLFDGFSASHEAIRWSP